jgi:hypothetical protein
MSASEYRARHDPASAMVQATARFLHGRAPAASRSARRADVEALSAWVTGTYPERRHPAVMLGSSCGAAVHLCAALGIPWLPQTFLVAARRRVRRRALGRDYARFLSERVHRGGTVYVLECGRPPPSDETAPEAEWAYEPAWDGDIEAVARDRHLRVRRIRFDEPEQLSPLVADLHRWWYRQRRMGASRLLVASSHLLDPHLALRTGSVPYWMRADTPASAEALDRFLDGKGMAPAGGRESGPVRRTAAGSGLRPHPGREPGPGDVDAPFDEIFVLLSPLGDHGEGRAAIERLQSIVSRAPVRGDILAAGEAHRRGGLAAVTAYGAAVRRLVPAQYPLPGPLAEADLDRFLDRFGDRYPVGWSG